MARFDETDGFGHPSEARQRPVYDPLFGDWGPAASAPSDDDGDSLFGYRPASANGDPVHNFNAYNPQTAAAVATAPAYQPQLEEERLTELQRRLREGTVTMPSERRWAVTIRELAETLLLAALIFLSVRASFQNFRVEGASMNPSLENGEYLIVNKLSYATLDLSMFNWLPFFDAGDNPVHNLLGGPSRGDVIVFAAPTSPNRDFIKRVIGLPGDIVQIDQQTGTVMVNGKTLEEPYIQGTTACNTACLYSIPPAGSAEAQAECGSSECFFVMGDNRQNSSDSRQGWLVPKENIVGKTFVTYWEAGSPNIGLAPNHTVGFASDGASSSTSPTPVPSPTPTAVPSQ